MKKFCSFVVLIAVFAFMIALSYDSKAENASETPNTTQDIALPTVDTVENLRSILAEANKTKSALQYRLAGSELVLTGSELVMEDNSSSSMSAPQIISEQKSASASSSESADYSQTNLQVAGVDEADLVKNDGEYIYRVNNQELIIAQVFPAGSMNIVSRIQFEQDTFTPQELYLDANYLVVIGNAYYQESSPSLYRQKDPTGEETAKSIPDQDRPDALSYPPLYSKSTVKAIVYNLEDKADLQKIREVELDGNYLSSRKIGSNLYLVANKYLDTYHIMQPSYRDTAVQEQFIDIGYNDIRYFPNFLEPNYLLVAGLDLNRPDKEIQVSTYLGSAENIYASAANLYVAVTQYQQTGQTDLEPLQTITALYKFGLAGGEIIYKNKGEAPGTILSQFSMDENNGFFRIATTTGDMWRTDNYTSKNNVYILDENLQLTGKIEDIAPGEKIYAARFLGDRGYLVTFKNVDPFFVLDLKDPASPQILGALKIPGYSDYLHPYDDNHILAFGKDTVELTQYGATNAYYQGLKLAVFDVSDVANPVEKYKLIIGDRGTDSDVLYNHKALLFDKEKGLLSFPVTLREVKNQEKYYQDNFLNYGEFTFQGAYVYHFDLENGFNLRGKISHLTDEDLLKSGWSYFGPKAVERIIFIEDTLYTISQGLIKANDLASLQEKNSLVLNP